MLHEDHCIKKAGLKPPVGLNLRWRGNNILLFYHTWKAKLKQISVVLGFFFLFIVLLLLLLEIKALAPDLDSTPPQQASILPKAFHY